MRRMFSIALGLSALAGGVAFAAAEQHHLHWSYSGEGGPSHWAEVDAKYAACASGRSQSPIDIRSLAARIAALPALDFQYEPTPLHIVDNGHSVQVNVEPGSALQIGRERYALVQFHFHHPAEERIDGKAAAMVAHLVHRDANGRLAVVAVEFNAGASNPMIATLWRDLPKEKEHEAAPAGVRIDPKALLPASRGYYTYQGSLTTPPCTEGVRWIVLKSPSTLSPGEIAAFARLYPNDARPVQKLNGRVVMISK